MKIKLKSKVVTYDYEVSIKGTVRYFSIDFINNKFKSCKYALSSMYSREDWNLLELINKKINKLEIIHNKKINK